MGNQKTDIKDKVVSRLVSTYWAIKVQDAFIAGWRTTWGRAYRLPQSER